MIKVQALSKSFQHRQVVADLSFEAPGGAITGLLGANGAGKTTTLRMICGALQPQSGAVVIDDLGPYAAPLERRRHIGALLDTGLYSRLTVRENLRYFGRLHGLTSDVLEDRTDAVVSFLGLHGIADRRTAGFSQGERMKTALARALLHQPRNLLLDEPTNVFSSHVLEEVQALCDQVVIVANGRRVAQGSPGEICAQTAAESLEDAFVRLTVC
jgi:sodium transport system ATP-binding protein